MLARVVCSCLGAATIVVALQSCTSVLGMERATLEVSTDGGDVKYKGLCVAPPTADCTNCLEAECGSPYANCINDSKCRAGFDSYAACLGDACNTPAASCIPKLSAELRDCASACTRKCAGTTLAAPCDLYCACMPVCKDSVAVRSTPDCLTQCALDEQNHPGTAKCLRSHCDLSGGGQFHCEHALNETVHVCDDAPATPTATCLGLAERGWACNNDDDCCSTSCAGKGSCD